MDLNVLRRVDVDTQEGSVIYLVDVKPMPLLSHPNVKMLPQNAISMEVIVLKAKPAHFRQHRLIVWL